MVVWKHIVKRMIMFSKHGGTFLSRIGVPISYPHKDGRKTIGYMNLELR